VISKKTASEVKGIILEYLRDEDQAEHMLRRLAKVEGNKSFKESVALLARLFDKDGEW
jgi:hypothetical protein